MLVLVSKFNLLAYISTNYSYLVNIFKISGLKKTPRGVSRGLSMEKFVEKVYFLFFLHFLVLISCTVHEQLFYDSMFLTSI